MQRRQATLVLGIGCCTSVHQSLHLPGGSRGVRGGRGAAVDSGRCVKGWREWPPAGRGRAGRRATAPKPPAGSVQASRQHHSRVQQPVVTGDCCASSHGTGAQERGGEEGRAVWQGRMGGRRDRAPQSVLTRRVRLVLHRRQSVYMCAVRGGGMKKMARSTPRVQCFPLQSSNEKCQFYCARGYEGREDRTLKKCCIYWCRHDDVTILLALPPSFAGRLTISRGVSRALSQRSMQMVQL